MADGIDALFVACDLDGSGYIDRDELALVCSDLTPDEVGAVFNQLDIDGDGRISLSEFCAGFQAMSETMANTREKLNKRRQSLIDINVVPMTTPHRDTVTSSRSRGQRSTKGSEGSGARRQRRKSLFDLIGNLDEAFTTLTW